MINESSLLLDSSYILNRTGSVKNDPKKNHKSIEEEEMLANSG